MEFIYTSNNEKTYADYTFRINVDLDLSRLVAGGVLPFESVAFENGLTLNPQITDGIITLGNSTQISQLVSILVDNATRHSRNGKEVFISLPLHF